MIKFMVCVCLLLFLFGCGIRETAVETVEDSVVTTASVAWNEVACSISGGLPEGAETVFQDENSTCYWVDDGMLEVEHIRILSADVSSAAKLLSGYASDDLTIMKLNKFSLPEYRFSWYAQTESGGRVYTADMVIDGICCYAVVCSVDERAGNAYEDHINEVISSFVLSFDESI